MTTEILPAGVTSAAGANESPDPAEVRVWDPLFRIFHWTLVVAFAVAFMDKG